MEFGLRPVGGLQVEYDDVGEVLTVLILTTEDEQFAALPETCGMSHSYARNVSVVVNQIPLSGDEVEAEDVVVHLVGILVEASKGVYLIIANISDRGIDQAGGLGADCRNHFRFVAFDG